MRGVASLMFEQENGVDFSRLNEPERQVLRLLAEGHTAKSIANELGSTPAAVNERLREARRKTGVGSSRELARLLKSQESRDEQMGMVEPQGRVALLPALAAEPWRPQPGVWVMLALLLGAIGVAAVLSSHGSDAGNQASAVVDPLMTIPSSEDAPDKLHRRIRSEPRDAAWAPKAEEIVRARYSKIERIGTPNAVLRVLCASTLCEVAGTIDAPEPKGKEYDDPNHPLIRANRELQEAAIYEDLKKAGLERVAGMFGSTATEPKRAAFIMYYKRVKS